MPGIEGIVKSVSLVVDRRPCTQSGILFVNATAVDQLAERLIAGGILCLYRPDGVVSTRLVGAEIL